jgi:ribosome biogenesis protein SSF1/2
VAYSPEKGSIEIRHYAITVRPAGVSKRVRRVLEGPSANAVKAKTAREGKDGKDGKEKVGREGSAAPSVASTSAGTNASMPHAGTRGVLDLGREKDVADYVLRLSGIGPADGYESAASDASSAAGDDGAAVDLASDYVGRGNKKGARRAVRLDEIGPRMDIRLVKIAEGVPGKEGEVIYHEFGKSLFVVSDTVYLSWPIAIVKKSKKEVAKQRAEHAEREKIRKQRREEQEKNVERKKAEATSTKDKGKSVAFADGEGDEEDGDDVGENEDEDEDMDGEQALSEDDGDGDEGWDEDADADEGGNDSGSDEDSDDEDEAPPPPRKKKK